MFWNILLLLGGFVLLVKGADFLSMAVLPLQDFSVFRGLLLVLRLLLWEPVHLRQR